MEAPAWIAHLNANPLPWLLSEDHPPIRHQALLQLLGRSPDDQEVQQALATTMQSPPISAILEAQYPQGYWVKPGPGYAPKYRGTVWQVIFLDQLGADGGHPQVRAACEYAIQHTQTESGAFGCSGQVREQPPPPFAVIHCLHGNLLRAFLGFGWAADERVQRAIRWQARAITGEDGVRFYRSSTCAPGFACAANEHLPCAWGAVKALGALNRVPAELRTPQVQRAIEQTAGFLLSTGPETAAYPVAWGNTKPSGSWFKLGFPLGYVTDVLQNMEVLCEAGFARDERLDGAFRWLLSLQDEAGRWKNRNSYHGKTWVDFEKQGEPSKWVTLRACRVLKARYGDKSS